MFVLPRQLVNILPKSKKKIMNKYSDMYPEKFEIDVTVGLKYIYSEIYYHIIMMIT